MEKSQIRGNVKEPKNPMNKKLQRILKNILRQMKTKTQHTICMEN